MRRRPTIPLSLWRIATDLEGSKFVQGQGANPFEGCDCKDCANWKIVAQKIIPHELATQLNRFGIDIARPTDTYVFGAYQELVRYRVMYHIVGKVLTGATKAHDFTTIHSEPYPVLMRIVPAGQLYEHVPKRHDGSSQDVLCVELFLDDVPENLASL